MVKTFGKGLAVLIIVLLVGVFAFLGYALQVHDRAIGAGTPYTMDELRALSDLLDPPGSPGMELPEGLPTKLDNLLLDRDRALKYSRKKQKERTEIWLRSQLIQLENGISQIQGKPSMNAPHIPAFVGSDKMKLGDFDAARRYYWAAVEVYKTTDPVQCKFALSTLYLLEDDPEKAAFLLQLSCQGTNSKWDFTAPRLLGAYSFCNMYENHALADYYLERLWAEYPVKAKEYESEHKIPWRE